MESSGGKISDWSQQDSGKIQEHIDYFKHHKNSRNTIDLFVVDEAHNLRNQGSTRYQKILQLFQENPQSRVLLLTATPINNSLIDFANQIQLGAKGDLVSINVLYKSNKGKTLEYIDFFEQSIKRIQSKATRAESVEKNLIGISIKYYYRRNKALSC